MGKQMLDNYIFRLRLDLVIHLRLPIDLTEAEVDRIYRFISTIPIAEDANTDVLAAENNDQPSDDSQPGEARSEGDNPDEDQPDDQRSSQRFATLLESLCERFKIEHAGPGRPAVPMNDMIFAIVYKAHCKLSSRELGDVLSTAPHYNSVITGPGLREGDGAVARAPVCLHGEAQGFCCHRGRI